jgi:2-keto-3-deoxy-L-rhamnonate aldolase RhmA
MPANAAKARPGLTFWLPVIWLAAVIAAAATAGLWAVPAFDFMALDNLHAFPGTRDTNAVLQNADDLEKRSLLQPPPQPAAVSGHAVRGYNRFARIKNRSWKRQAWGA